MDWKVILKMLSCLLNEIICWNRAKLTNVLNHVNFCTLNQIKKILEHKDNLIEPRLAVWVVTNGILYCRCVFVPWQILISELFIQTLGNILHSGIQVPSSVHVTVLSKSFYEYSKIWNIFYNFVHPIYINEGSVNNSYNSQYCTVIHEDNKCSVSFPSWRLPLLQYCSIIFHSFWVETGNWVYHRARVGKLRKKEQISHTGFCKHPPC